jgi:hypothetical protein
MDIQASQFYESKSRVGGIAAPYKLPQGLKISINPAFCGAEIKGII